LPGAGAGFYVTAGGARPLTYRWLKDGVDMGRTNRILILNNLTATDVAQYSCLVSNSFGTVTSSAAGLTFATSGFPNPSFEGEIFQTWPGYIANNFPIAGWFVSDTNRVGVNLADGLSPFANNGTAPQGSKVALLQNAGTATLGAVSNWMSTTFQGLTPGQPYTLKFAVNSRNTQKPNVHVAIDGQSLSDILISSVGGTNPYKRVAFDFTPANSSITLALTNDAANDTTVLLDDFSIVPSTTQWSFAQWTDDASSGVDSSKFYTHALNFGSPEDTVINGVTFRGAAGPNPSVPGFYSTAGFGLLFINDANVLTAAGGGSAGLATNFLYGGPVQTITLTNLVPGIEYVATIYGVAFDPRNVGRAATFAVGNDIQTINLDHFGNDVGMRVSYRYTAGANGSITFTYTPTDANSTFHTYGFANYQLNGSAPVIATDITDVFAVVGDTVTLSIPLSAGAQPTYYQWQLGTTDIPDQTNATLVLSNITAGAIESYRVIVSNSFGSVTSRLATVEWGLPIAELFNTGVDDSRNFLSGGQVDSHYQLISSGDPAFPGPNALVMHNGAFPLAGNYFTNGLFSSWISPRTNSTVGNSNGFYVYRTTFLMDVTDPGHAQINGKWASDNEAVDIRLNGVSLGISNMVSAAFTTFYPFTITNGFVAGSNYVDFVISNGPAAGPTALRAELRGVARPLAPAKPQITQQPIAPPIVQEGQDLTLSVIAVGSAPLTYQWYVDEIDFEIDLPGKTSRTLRFNNVSQVDQNGVQYWVRITNPEGFTNSIPVVLYVNAQPVANPDYVATGSNQPLTFSVSKLLFNDTDLENDALSLSLLGGFSANGGTVSLSSGLITYTPTATFTGADTFSYRLADARGGSATSTVNVTVGATNFLSISTPPALLPNGHFGVSYSGVARYPYTVERAPNVTGPWQVFTNIAADVNGAFTVDDPNDPPLPMRFYRTRYP
jgi:hypothetical protein